MNWLQTFAFVAFAGFHGAWGRHDMFRQNTPVNPGTFGVPQISFPYKQSFTRKYANRDMYTSAVVSISSGPLCSGFHVAIDTVVTAASCVYRKNAGDLMIISNGYYNETLKDIYMVHYLKVTDLKIHPKYDPSNNAHNIALLLVTEPTDKVPILSLPEVSNLQEEIPDGTYFVKFTYSDSKTDFYSEKVSGEVKVNLNDCTSKGSDVPPGVFFCVQRADSKLLEYGLRDLGTPLVYTEGNEDFFLGMFAGHRYHTKQKSYLYQGLTENLEFINDYLHPSPLPPLTIKL